MNRRRTILARATRRVVCLAAASVLAVSAGAARAAIDEASQAYEQALIRFQADDLEGAVLGLKRALSANARLLPAHLLLARVYLRIGEGAAAEDALRTAARLGGDESVLWPLRAQALMLQFKYKALLARVPDHGLEPKLQARMLIFRGQARLAIGDTDNAEKSFQEAERLAPGTAGPLVAMAALELRRGRVAAAEVDAVRAVRLAPDNADAWNAVGEVRHMRGELESALEAYSRALELAPGHHDARVSRVGVLLDLGKLDAVESDLTYLLTNFPRDPRGAYLNAVYLSKRGKHQEARQALEHASAVLGEIGDSVIDRSPQLILLVALADYELGSFEQAEKFLRRYIDRFPEQVGPRKLLGSILIRQGRSLEASQLLEPALDRAPNDYRLLSLLATALMQRGRHETATRYLERAIKLSPKDDPTLRMKLAASKLQTGFEEQGLDELEKLFQEDPKHRQDAGLMLATAYLQHRDAKNAARIAAVLHDNAPDNLTVVNLLASARLAEGQGDQARILFERALAIDSKFVPARVNLAHLASLRGDVTEARKELEQALADNPDNVRVMVDLGRLEERAGRVAVALRWIEKARATQPHSIPAVLALIDLHLRAEQPKEALRVAQEAQTFAPENLDVLTALGRTYLALQEPDRAQAVFKEMVKIAGFEARKLYPVAELQLRAGADEDAMYTLHKALQGDPAYLPARASLVSVQIRRGLLDDARDGAKGIINDRPKLAIGYRLLGEVQARTGAATDSVASYRKALAIDDGDVDALGVYRGLWSAESAKAALAFLGEWVSGHPHNVPARRALAEGYLGAGQLDEARAAYEALLEDVPTDPVALNNLANVLDRQGSPKALDLAARAYAVAPTDPAVLDTYGWLLVRSGAADRGLPLLRDAQARVASSPEIRYHIARALVELGRDDEALRTLDALAESSQPFDGQEDAQALRSRLEARKSQ